MADNKSGRDKQAHDVEKRQRERDLDEELERRDEKEPRIGIEDLADLDANLEFPATGSELVSEVGDYEVESGDKTYRLAELIPDTDGEEFDSPAAVSVQVERPTVATAMKRVLEASETLPNTELRGSQRKAYEKTFRALAAVDADDDDEGIRVIGDWIVERIHEKEKLPGSREVRREAAKFCRKNGYQIRNDQWLGI